MTATPLVVTPGTLFPYIVGKATLNRAAIEVAFGLWLALVIHGRSQRPRQLRPSAQEGSWVFTTFAAWLGVSMVCAFAGVSPVRSCTGITTKWGRRLAYPSGRHEVHPVTRIDSCNNKVLSPEVAHA